METSSLWRHPDHPGIELLSARYTRFEFSRHWHDELAIGVIEAGAEGLDYRGDRLLIPEQHIVAINPAEVHTGFAGADQGWTYRMFYFDPQLLGQLLEHAGGPPLDPVIERPVIHDPALLTLLLALHRALEQPSLSLTRDTLLSQCLERLFRHHGQRSSTPTPALDRPAAQRVHDYLHDHWRSNVSLDTLETVTGASRFQLIRSFQASYGVTPHQFLLLLKVRHAKLSLAAGCSQLDTALACGFYDQSHFSRNFKRAFGVPPSHYRTG